MPFDPSARASSGPYLRLLFSQKKLVLLLISGVPLLCVAASLPVGEETVAPLPWIR